MPVRRWLLSVLGGGIILSACQAAIPASPTPATASWPPVFELKAPEVGVVYAMNVWAACGVGFMIDGEGWLAEERSLPTDFASAFTLPVDQGTIVLTDSDHAVYVSSRGWRIVVVRHRGALPSVPPCF